MKANKKEIEKKISEELGYKVELIPDDFLPLPGMRASRAALKVVIDKPNIYGVGLKVAIREKAKKMAAYHREIKWPFSGQTDSGDEIPINTVGRWIFGTPGYMGHAIFEGGCSEQIVIWLPLGTPQIVSEILIDACNMLECPICLRTPCKCD